MPPTRTDQTPDNTTAARKAEGPLNCSPAKRGPPVLVSPDADSSPELPARRKRPRRKKASRSASTDSEGASQPPEPRYLLCLYVAGFTALSTTAISNLKAICEEQLKGRYELRVVDIYQQPALARRAHITAAPTLIRRLPMPLRRIVGDMSRKDRVLSGLDLPPRV
jgi:circadian clock protein KaiB